MAHSFSMTRSVTFAETDMAGILHFSNYFRYMEEAEHAFFRSLGFRVHACERSGAWGWARRNAAPGAGPPAPKQCPAHSQRAFTTHEVRAHQPGLCFVKL